MESIIIDQWLKNFGSGFGDGFGYGYGDGFSSSGYGYGDGSGDGCVYGDRYCSGFCLIDGSGSGDGGGDGIRILRYRNQKVYYIDGIPMIIRSINGNFAKGSRINLDTFRENQCFIARSEDGTFFAYGDTLREVYEILSI